MGGMGGEERLGDTDGRNRKEGRLEGTRGGREEEWQNGEEMLAKKG